MEHFWAGCRGGRWRGEEREVGNGVRNVGYCRKLAGSGGLRRVREEEVRLV